MSIRPDGLTYAIVCDHCGERITTACTKPLLAFNEATMEHGWTTPGPRYGNGVRCPWCPSTPINRELPHFHEVKA